MSKLLIDSTTLTNIADAIRSKINSVDLYSPTEMVARIWEIQNSNNFKLGQKIITENGVYNSADEIANPLDGYSQVIVSVLNNYTARDENKVIQNGKLITQTPLLIDRNGSYDTTVNNSVEVQVPSESANLGTKTIEENGNYRAIDDGYDGYYNVEVNIPTQEVALGMKTFLTRGEYQAADDNLDGYSTVIVNTTNSYLEEENHQVVVGQRLFPQTSTYITENGTYDTTLNNETIVNIQPPLQNKTIIENGTFAADTGYYGLNTIIVNLPNVYYINDIDKVVLSNGLSIQTSRIITSNGNYNTTFNNNLVISVPSDLDFIEGNITSNLNRSDITKVRAHAFRQLSILTAVNLPNCSYVGDYAFYSCSKIQSVSLLNCSYLGSNAFYSCSNLSVVSLPKCSYIGTSAFYRCSSLTNISLPKCSYVGTSAFTYCSQLTSVTLTQCSGLLGSTFSNCINLETINLPNCQYTSGFYIFYNCYNLSEISLPNCTKISYCNYLFWYCSKLTTLSLPKCSFISDAFYAFSGCSNFKALYLMSTSVCVLSTSDFINCGNFISSNSYINGYASIYVPQSLLASYKTANNWSYFSKRFVGI